MFSFISFYIAPKLQSLTENLIPSHCFSDTIPVQTTITFILYFSLKFLFPFLPLLPMVYAQPNYQG